MSVNLYSKDFPRTHSYPLPRLNKCVECKTATIEKYQTKLRQVRRFGGYQGLIEHILTCPNPKCEQFNQNIYPERFTPPNSAYHWEVIHEVGRLRRKEKKTFEVITQILKDRGVPIGSNSSCAKHLFQYYEIYELGWKENTLSTQCQGQDVILAMDGAKPENGTPTLYLISDAQQAMMYHSDWLLYSGKDQLKSLLQQITRLNLNIVGFVSDKQRAILLAVREIFGKIPHQFCQFHWIQAAFRHLSDHDRQLNKELKKRLRKLRDLTRLQIQRVNSGYTSSYNLFILDKLTPFLTVVLQAKNKPPFILKGFQNWERVKLLLSQTLALLSDLNTNSLDQSSRIYSPEQKSLVNIARILGRCLEHTGFDAWEVQQGSQWLKVLVPLLDPEDQPFEWNWIVSPAKCAKQEFQRCVTKFKSRGSTFLIQLKENILTHLDKWKDGLFVCFDYPFIPRTNNHLEGFIYQLKQGQTKTSGRRNNHTTLRRQQCFQYKSQFPLWRQFEEYCESLSLKKYQNFQQQYLIRLKPIKEEYRIKRDYSGMVDKLFTFIRQEVAVSAICT